MTTTTTQTDRELLELAAKAAGYPWRGWTADKNGPVALLQEDVSKPAPRICCPTPWKPREDDGDSRRLAVALYFTVAVRPHEVEVFSDEGECLASVPIFTASAFVKSEEATKPTEATRLAVLLAAAEIGRAMP